MVKQKHPPRIQPALGDTEIAYPRKKEDISQGVGGGLGERSNSRRKPEIKRRGKKAAFTVGGVEWLKDRLKVQINKNS